ncbi:MAG: hypothetical protein EBY38_06230 [Flavobacteriaceae bacterium]|jgi:hypothetical protein|nr:hypothetical protein [Flavobacteriaceae bacterium]
MKIKLPPIKHGFSVVDAAMSQGRYSICPERSHSAPDVSEPMHNPDRIDNVVRWVPNLFSFEVPDGGAFFCDLLQNGDMSSAWSEAIEENNDDWFDEGEIDETE